MKLFLVALILLTGCSTARKPCQVERICNQHNADMQKMLKDYPETTMDILKTIATLEEETGHYK